MERSLRRNHLQKPTVGTATTLGHQRIRIWIWRAGGAEGLGGEVLPAAGLEFGGVAVFVLDGDFVALGDVADEGERDAFVFGGDAAAGRNGEQELVLVSAVQGVAQLDLVAVERGDGDGVLLQDGSGAGGAAEAGEIDGEAVADVDHGRGNLLVGQEAGELELGLGIEVRGIGRGAEAALGDGVHLLQQGERRAQLSADEDAVAGRGGAAQDGAALRDGADDGDVGEHAGGGFGDISAGQGDAGGFGGFQQAVKELVGPALRQIGGQGEREKRGKGLAAHGRDVGESAGEAAVADRVGGMPLAAEVHAFQGEVGGDQGLRAWQGGEQGAIVSDGLEDAGRSGAPQRWERRLAGLRDAFDETIFRDRHARKEYSESRAEGKRGEAGFKVSKY